jgi:endonuclease/exonuclease/phosphatase family metal-dependent hydrolase
LRRVPESARRLQCEVEMRRCTVPVLLTLPLLLTSACLVGEDGETEDETLLIEGKVTAPVRIIQHNIEKKLEVLQQTLAKANAIGAHAVALQEVCPDQVQWLRANYGDKWTIGDASNKKRTLQGCDLPDGTHDFPHDVVIYRGGTDGSLKYYDTLGGPTNAPGNKLICVRFERAKVPVHFCSVHLIAGDWTDPATGTKYDGAAVREQQTTGLKRIAREDWFDGAKNHFGIIAGDFNTQPHSAAIDKIYDSSLNGTGDFTEYNRSGGSRDGEMTAHADGSNAEDGQPYSKKIDYVFFSTNRASLDGPNVNIIPDASDHDMVISTVNMKK